MSQPTTGRYPLQKIVSSSAECKETWSSELLKIEHQFSAEEYCVKALGNSSPRSKKELDKTISTLRYL